MKGHDDLSDGVGCKHDRHLFTSVSQHRCSSVCSRDERMVQILATFRSAGLRAFLILNKDCAMNADNYLQKFLYKFYLFFYFSAITL
jgi:hypothetical protein